MNSCKRILYINRSKELFAINPFLFIIGPQTKRHYRLFNNNWRQKKKTNKRITAQTEMNLCFFFKNTLWLVSLGVFYTRIHRSFFHAIFSLARTFLLKQKKIYPSDTFVVVDTALVFREFLPMFLHWKKKKKLFIRDFFRLVLRLLLFRYSLLKRAAPQRDASPFRSFISGVGRLLLLFVRVFSPLPHPLTRSSAP